jgi:hypothetical protein
VRHAVLPRRLLLLMPALCSGRSLSGWHGNQRWVLLLLLLLLLVPLLPLLALSK